MPRSTYADRQSDIDVAMGRVPGTTYINKFGHNPDVDTGAAEDIWCGGGIYAFYFDTNQTTQAESTSLNDVGTEVSAGTATGGSFATLVDSGADFVSDGVALGDVVINDTTGEYGTVSAVTATTLTHTAMSNASTVEPSAVGNTVGNAYRIGSSASTGAGVLHVEILYNSNGIWSVVTETVILDGQTPVILTLGSVRQYRGTILHAGASGTNEGEVTVGVNAGAVGICIQIGDGKTQQAIFTIPSGKVGLFLKGYVGIAGGGSPAVTTATTFTWRARTNNGSTGVFAINGQIQLQTNGSPWWIYEYALPPRLPEKTDILIRADEVSANGMSLVGAFDMQLENV